MKVTVVVLVVEDVEVDDVEVEVMDVNVDVVIVLVVAVVVTVVVGLVCWQLGGFNAPACISDCALFNNTAVSRQPSS